MLLYVSLIVYFLKKIGLWDIGLLKDTVLWFFGVAFIMVINFNKVSENEYYFRKVLLDNLKLVVLLEFIINLYVFSLAVEIILLPVLFSIVVLSAVAESKKEFLIVRKVSNFILGLAGICFVIFALTNTFMDFRSFANPENLHSLLLPPILTLSFLPFIYFFALYSLYESFFIRIDIFNDDKAISRYAKRKIFTKFHINLRRLRKFTKEVGIMRLKDKKDVQKILHEFED